jgi:hypothetical protein
MKRSSAIMSVAAAAVLIGVFLGGRATSSQDHRYSTQMVGVPGMIAPFVSITDNREQKLYLYSSEKSSLALRMSVDLTRTGQPMIEVQEAAEPTTRPANRGR